MALKLCHAPQTASRGGDMISVHAFKRWNHKKAEYDFPKFKRTADAIRACGGVIIPETEEKVASDKVDWSGRYDPTHLSSEIRGRG
jgi:hypothetical protein